MSTQTEKPLLTDEQVHDLLNSFFKEEQKARQSIDLPFDEPARVVFNTVVDAMRMFTELKKNGGPTKIHVPKSLEIMLDMHLKRQLDDEHKGLRSSKKFLGCALILDAPHFKFE